MELDLGSLASVHRFADGFETQFCTNHLDRFLPTELLLDRLNASAPSRIVCFSGLAHVTRNEKTRRLDLDFEKRTFDGVHACSQSNPANVLHVVGLAERLEGSLRRDGCVRAGFARASSSTRRRRGCRAFCSNR